MLTTLCVYGSSTLRKSNAKSAQHLQMLCTSHSSTPFMRVVDVAIVRVLMLP
jgi:hypothetical protein